MKRALILVDIQNDFLPGGPLAVPDGDQIIPIVNTLMPAFDLVVATQDWHPAEHGSFAANHLDKTPFDQITLAGLPQTLWPIHCVQQSEGAAFATALDADRISHVIRKGTDPLVDSYSGFFDNNRQSSTGLGDYLREQNVTDVFIVGLATDYCVKATALDARRLGFRVTLIDDACRGVNLAPDDVTNALAEMRAAGVNLMHSSDVSLEIGDPKPLFEGKFLRLVQRHGWEYVERPRVSGIVAMIAVTDDQELILIEQHRPSFAASVIELPAGLAGDSGEDEDLLTAARRELAEETGYEAADMEIVAAGAPSAGLSNELVTIVRASGLRRSGAGGGVDGEKIKVHLIPVAQVRGWIKQQHDQGRLLDLKVHAALAFL